MMAEKINDNIIIFPKIRKESPKSTLTEKQKKEIKDLQALPFANIRLNT